MQILDGKALAIKLKEEIKQKVQTIIHNKNIYPKLVIICIGDDPASQGYNRSIRKTCENVGINCDLLEYKTLDLEEAKHIIHQLNNDSTVHGILINQPLPNDLSNIVEYIDSKKDVEGVTAKSLGLLLLNQDTLIPCTPKAVIRIIDEYKIDLTGKKVCLIGRSNIVGKPLSILLTQKNATVILCHSKTKDLPNEVYSADVVVAAIGQPSFVKGEWIKEQAIVIDVGTNYTENGLIGDVDFKSAKEKASMITPVPGGIGSLTNIMLMENCFKAILLK